MSEDSLTKSLEITASQSKAFDFFVNHIYQWWPKEYTWSQEVLQEITIESHINGKCYELGPFDFRIEWGRVLDYNNPEYITFTWQISDKREPVPNPEKASRVYVNFQWIDENNAQLILEHQLFKNHGENYKNYLQAMDSEYGWDYILNCFKNKLEDHK